MRALDASVQGMAWLGIGPLVGVLAGGGIRIACSCAATLPIICEPLPAAPAACCGYDVYDSLRCNPPCSRGWSW